MSSMQISVIKKLGNGSYGQVFLCEDIHKHQFAIKAIPRDLFNDEKERSFNNEVMAFLKLRVSQESQLQEIEGKEQIPRTQVMRRSLTFDQGLIYAREQKQAFQISEHVLHDPQLEHLHSNIIRYIHHMKVFQLCFENKTISCHALFLEYAQNGCLGTYIESPNYKNVPLPVVRTIALQLLQGLKEMNQAGLVHRDIKCDNIVFSEDFSLKLIDLAFSCDSNETICGTDKYLAPEQIGKQVKVFTKESPIYITGLPVINDPSNEIKPEYSFEDFAKIDLFSTGVVLFRLITKTYPFFKATFSDHKYKNIVLKNYEEFWKTTNLLISNNDDETQEAVDIPSALIEALKREVMSAESYDVSHRDNVDLREKRRKQRALSITNPISCYGNLPNNHEDKCHRSNHHNTATIQEVMHDSSFNSLEPVHSFFDQVEQLKDLIQNLLQFKINERFNVNQALNHPFLSHESRFAAKNEMASFFAHVSQQSQ